MTFKRQHSQLGSKLRAMKFGFHTVVIRTKNLTIDGQNLTGMTYLQFLGHNASLKSRIISETNKPHLLAIH